jgi:hypothetical protein
MSCTAICRPYHLVSFLRDERDQAVFRSAPFFALERTVTIEIEVEKTSSSPGGE